MTELAAIGVTAAQLDGERLDIRGQNLSTHPYLLPGPSELSIKAQSGRMQAGVVLADKTTDGRNAVRFQYNDLQIDRIVPTLAVTGKAPLEGGTLDVDIDGTWSSLGVGYIDLPLNLTLHNTTVNVPGAGSAHVKKMLLPIGLRGPLDDPHITLDEDLLAQALLGAGADRLAGELRQQTDRLSEELGKQVGDTVGDDVHKALGDGVEGALKGLFDPK